ncbi:enoyl-CoA hydratase/isomerase family protein [Enterovirga rhinocerotis]|uniref:Enoyl-CoA hydratase/carnithine racemase n=1 Tax=Enterovirga rhinocerotis TaxID=1339210 RepID=A0A4R7C683_9HYPH|nr:enoyl-CoA hydratase/isomerase family protein [Enterovirga rhinocerotis]TDR94084.1 enoyl-CoA hydratase/carnithine racemase [Enterovirga rhinocerotis]
MTATEETAGPPILTIDGTVATLRLARPRHLNRIEPEDLVSLHESLDRLEAMRSVRVLVLTGTGRAFSSGYHLGDLARRSAAPAAAEPEDGGETAFERLANRIEDFALPTICRLNGGVYGGSTDLALACDFRIGTELTKMFMPAARLGLHYYRGGMVRYVTRLGPDAAKRLFLTAETLEAAEMLRIGYLTDLVPSAELDSRVADLAGRIAANAPRVTQAMKCTINEIARGDLDRAEANRRHHDSLRGAEIAEGMRAFREKRAPVFED